VLSIPELKGCLTCADNLEKGMEMLEDAKKQWLLAALESGYEISVIPGNSSFAFPNPSIRNWLKDQSRRYKHEPILRVPS